MGFRRILVAIDDGPVAAHAAEIAFDLARSVGAEVAVVYVVDPLSEVAPEGGVSADKVISAAEHEAKVMLAELRQRAGLEPEPLGFVPVGRPAAEIVTCARQWNADLIVMGSHGRRGIQRALLGSVAEAVLRHAPCATMVIRAPA